MEVKRKLFVCFVDYKKAFDRIHHEKLRHILQNIRLDSHDIMIIRNIYWNHRGCIRTANGNTSYINIQMGVRQGCLLSPLPFKYIVKQSLEDRPEGAKINGIVINNKRYADDTVVMGESEEQLQALLSTLTDESLRMGLEVKAAKTKTMVFDRNPQEQQVNIVINGVTLQNVHSYIYLDREINHHLNHAKEIKRRIEITRAALLKMRNILCRFIPRGENKNSKVLCGPYSPYILDHQNNKYGSFN